MTTEAIDAAAGQAAEMAEAAGHAAEAAEKGGMPQLDFSTFPNQIFWLLITLVVVYLILSRMALPRISSVLAERQGTITNDLGAAEELKLKAQEAEAAYNKALADARSEAQRIAAEAKAEIQADLDKAIAKADAEIAAKSAADVAKDLVTALGGKAEARTIKAAVVARLKG